MGRWIGVLCVLCGGAVAARGAESDEVSVGARRSSAPLVLSADDEVVATSVADEDVVVLLEADTLNERARVRVGRRPEAMVLLASGEIAVACAGEDVVAFIDPRTSEITRWIRTDVEPRALATDGRWLFVAASASATVSAYDLEDGRRAWTASLAAGTLGASHPSALALDDRGHLFVAYREADFVDELEAADGGVAGWYALGHGRVSQVQALVARGAEVLAPHVLAITASGGKMGASGLYGGGPADDMAIVGRLARLSHRVKPMASPVLRTSPPHRLGWVPARVPVESLFRPSSDALEAPVYMKGGRPTEQVRRAASLTAAALHPDGRLFLVDTAQSRLFVVNQVDHIGRARLPGLGVFNVGPAPTGIAFDRSGERTFMTFAHTRQLALVATAELTRADRPAPVAAFDSRDDHTWRVAELAAPRDLALARGELLFHIIDTRMSSRGVTCASCHPDGRSDGRIWDQADGLRQTPMLSQRVVGTAPYGWLGGAATVAEHITHTVAERLGGSGLDAYDTDALVRYVSDGLAPLPPAPAAQAEAQVGHGVFQRADVGCAGCHDPSTAYTDGQRYDVGIGRGEAFDVPSLVGLAHSAPYFHDGSAKTLRDAVITSNAHDRMGRTSQLAPDEIDALLAYLATL